MSTNPDHMLFNQYQRMYHYNHVPMPVYITKLIGKWICYGDLHIVAFEGQNCVQHWSIQVHKIFKLIK